VENRDHGVIDPDIMRCLGEIRVQLFKGTSGEGGLQRYMPVRGDIGPVHEKIKKVRHIGRSVQSPYQVRTTATDTSNLDIRHFVCIRAYRSLWMLINTGVNRPRYLVGFTMRYEEM
jgi:hypothetical protein